MKGIAATFASEKQLFVRKEQESEANKDPKSIVAQSQHGILKGQGSPPSVHSSLNMGSKVTLKNQSLRKSGAKKKIQDFSGQSQNISGIGSSSKSPGNKGKKRG